jgi:hypothetical protein
MLGLNVNKTVRRFTQKHPKIPKNTPEHPKITPKHSIHVLKNTILKKDYVLK